jgi:hypothetical protein
VIISGTRTEDVAGIPSKGRRFKLSHGSFVHVGANHFDRTAASWDNLSVQERLT